MKNVLRILALAVALLVLKLAFTPHEVEAQSPLRQRTNEVLVLTTPTRMNVEGGNSIELYNRGPNDIECCLGSNAGCVSTKARKVDKTGGSWSIDNRRIALWCISSANQVSGAATVVTEGP